MERDQSRAVTGSVYDIGKKTNKRAGEEESASSVFMLQVTSAGDVSHFIVDTQDLHLFL